MDTITHGIAGALIGKALFEGDEMLAFCPMNRQRVVTWALMLGAIFPDSDVFRDMFSHDPMLILTWHRSITHSLIFLPLWAVALAVLTHWMLRRFKWPSPGFGVLIGIYAVGILSHIVLDLVTTFGTMIWSPLNWSRPAWDLLFIVDLTFTAILLIPQLIPWVYSNPAKMRRRILWMCIVFVPLPLLVSLLLKNAGAPISVEAVALATMLLVVIFFGPALGGWGLRTRPRSWNRTGLLLACLYLLAALVAHKAAFGRIRRFAEFEHIEAQSIGALPLPPSLWRWDGLVLTTRGVYEVRMDLAHPERSGSASAVGDPIEYNFFPEARDNPYIQQARRLPEVQKVLWFARFPVTRFRREGTQMVVEISDVRFPQSRRSRAHPFTYEVRFDLAGNLLKQGWLRD
jgi:membrane-bound metal-dependent hydrolase YbcI (DUF457 family)